MTFDKDTFLKNGFLVMPSYYDVSQCHLDKADFLMTDKSYKGGRRFLTHDLSKITEPLLDLIFSDDIKSFFNSVVGLQLQCKDVMLTHDHKHDVMERNKWLHFDRWRSLKAMVYLTDVEKGCGAFSVVPESHHVGAKLRRSSNKLPYSIRPNRVKLDFPEFYTEPIQIYGPPGTLILFDSDIFHLGGKIEENKERILIRSHWYTNRKWQETV